ncbi:GrpB family protein [Paenibacillus xylaniclasticus]|uniref:GrpB family protein n=1 Tax=Paenibacillus xylaniclasticus TaxID=588083 RepID=UPI000FD78B61|nr:MULTISPECIES: GrpB family protein [Paenibacillus]GFN33983.1 hypothetical protein PCURB6_42430 [Paenibacillus curdlanolyticus]
MDKPVTIVEYDEAWAMEYQQEARKVMELLGNKAMDIEHIGSTSVLGLGAKPIIDFMLGVHHLSDADEFIEPLATIGYEYVGHKEFPNRRFFRKGEWRAGTHHLHIYKYKSDEWNKHILFRDYLRAHSDVREQYHQLKKSLAERYRYDRAAYTNAKHPFITGVIERAKAERRGSN